MNGQNPLLCAAKHGKDETVKYLLNLDNQVLECSKVRTTVSSITLSLNSCTAISACDNELSDSLNLYRIKH